MSDTLVGIKKRKTLSFEVIIFHIVKIGTQTIIRIQCMETNRQDWKHIKL